MKKSNAITLLSFAIITASVLLSMFFWKTPVENADDRNPLAESGASVLPQEPVETEGEQHQAVPAEDPVSEKVNVTMEDALFIGDSRTVGLSEYADIDGADFFATVGMSVYNIRKQTISVPTVGKVTLDELLQSKTYGKIYCMLGINELGYPFDDTLTQYQKLIEQIKEQQPDADIFVQANLHVTKRRSESDAVINNPAIDQMNASIAQIADGKSIFYLDVNVLFDDQYGSLAADKTDDNTHPYAKYYQQWGEWIVKQTALQYEEAAL